MAEIHTLKFLDSSQVSPPPNTVPRTQLPLSFLDLPFFIFHPIKRIFFYKLPHPPNLSLLKHSLSLTLQHFFPLTSKIIFPPPPQPPHFLYSPGDAAIPFIVAESSADFNHLVGDHSRDVTLFHLLLPDLPPPVVSPDDGTAVFRAMAVQVTVFPGSGICIGVTFNHVVADGMAFGHFMKSWASVCKMKGDLSFIHQLQPFHGRNEIHDLDGLNALILNQLQQWKSSLKNDKESLLNLHQGSL